MFSAKINYRLCKYLKDGVCSKRKKSCEKNIDCIDFEMNSYFFEKD